MSEERLQKIKGSVEFQKEMLKAHNMTALSLDEEEELIEEIERLNNVIKRLEEDLREMYLTFGEFSEEYTENKIKELIGSDSYENL